MAKTLLSELVMRQAEKYGDRTALMYRDYQTSTWIHVSWNQFADKVRTAANALIELQVAEHENIGIFSQNMPECLYLDYANFSIKAVSVPLYATSSAAQVNYIIQNAEIKYLFVGEQLQYDVAFRVQRVCESLLKIIILDPEVKLAKGDTSSIFFDDFMKLGGGYRHQQTVDDRIADNDHGDTVILLYTSGTTGESKGVMLTHHNFEFAFVQHDKLFPKLGPDDLVMNFLPYTHVFERAWTHLCIYRGCTLAVNRYPQDILMAIKEVHPTAMCSVPRFWEKVYSGVQEKIHQSPPMQKALMLDAVHVGKAHNVDYLMKGKTPPAWLRLKYKFYERTIYRLLKKAIGLENGRYFPTAGAAIPNKVEEFVKSVGINMIAGYGMTETTATIACQMDMNYSVGAVGLPLDGIQVRIGENNEIQLKGDTVMRGYYKKEEVTRQSYTADGWFKTGDAGYFDERGFLYLTDRIKEMFKTSNGKYIAPQMIESKMVVDRYIDQISVIADQRKFVSALIVPDYPQVEGYAKSQGIEYGSMAELLQKPEIQELFRTRIDTLQQEFAGYEQIKRFTLLPEPFSMEKGELTNTLKVKRAVLAKNYAAEIDKMYEE